MSFLLNRHSAIKVNPIIWTTNIITLYIISLFGTGISNRLRHEAMWVVIKKGWIASKVGTSKVPMIVNNMITAMVLTIGPMELSEKTEKQIDMVAMDKSDKYAKQNAKPYLHMISDSGIMTSPSLFNTIKSPVPNIICPTIRDKKASHKVRKKVYIAPAKNFDNRKLLRLIGFVPIILNVPMAASPETKSPVTSATNKGT